jgi:drug/metabolite transporter (DMT)-like permease
VAQDIAAQTIPPFTFLALRSATGVLALTAVLLLRDGFLKKEKLYVPPTPAQKKKMALGGSICGLFLFTASALQQFGIAGNAGSPGKDAFITALYIVFVPVLGLFFKRKAEPHIYVCVLVALGGLWLLCMNGSSLTVSDIQLIACSLLYAGQMLSVELMGSDVDGVRLSLTQFVVVTVGSGICAILFEDPTAAGISAGWWTILYAGILSTGLSYTLQIIGQQRVPGPASCLVLSLESVFGVLSGMVALHLFPTLTEIMGMVIIFIAIVVAQLPFPYKKKKAY